MIFYRLMKIILAVSLFAFMSCQPSVKDTAHPAKALVSQYEEVELSADLSWLSESERSMIPLLISAADIVDEIFWLQSYGVKDELMDALDDPYLKEYALINYGPWGRLEGHTAFINGFHDKFPGARFYPPDMEREEFDAWQDADKNHPYTLIRRGADGALKAVPYSQAYASQTQKIAELLQDAALMSGYKPFARYLENLANGLLKDDFSKADKAWMRMQDNNIDLVLRPLDTGEDRLFGYKAAHSAYLVVKDIEWSQRLERFSGLAPTLQARLPVPDLYKQEVPADDSEIFVYDAIYYAGHCNAGPKIIALHLPRDPKVQAVTGTRSMQLKNVMEAKFDKILLPISKMMIDERQQKYISSDAFFMLTAFHEIAAALGISNTVNRKGTVQNALREYHGTIDATVTDLMALYLIMQLHELGEITQQEVHEAYVTSFASVMRSSRFGTAGAHGIAGMIRFNIFEREQVFTRGADQTYYVHVDKMKNAVENALQKLLIIQGDGNYEAASKIVERDGSMPEGLKADINRINKANIPVDVYFRQGLEYLELE